MASAMTMRSGNPALTADTFAKYRVVPGAERMTSAERSIRRPFHSSFCWWRPAMFGTAGRLIRAWGRGSWFQS